MNFASSTLEPMDALPESWAARAGAHRIREGRLRSTTHAKPTRRQLVGRAPAPYLHAVPRVFPLRTDNLPDIGDHLVHFTGRTAVDSPCQATSGISPTPIVSRRSSTRAGSAPSPPSARADGRSWRLRKLAGLGLQLISEGQPPTKRCRAFRNCPISDIAEDYRESIAERLRLVESRAIRQLQQEYRKGPRNVGPAESESRPSSHAQACSACATGT